MKENPMEEQQVPVVAPAEVEEQRFKTLGVRIEEGLHAQLTFIAQLTESTIADEIRRSIEARVQSAQSDPELIARAEAVRTQIEREAEARKQAIASLFGGVALGGAVEAPRGGRRGGRAARDSGEGGSTSE
jgi:uncharacterized membrane-anchored protein YjiN (DUF445 family)